MKEINSNWDTYDFQDWVVRHINLILGGKELELFIRNNFGYDDIKMFGKLDEAENLKSLYQSSMVDKARQALLRWERHKLTFNSGELQWSK